MFTHISYKKINKENWWKFLWNVVIKRIWFRPTDVKLCVKINIYYEYFMQMCVQFNIALSVSYEFWQLFSHSNACLLHMEK